MSEKPWYYVKFNKAVGPVNHYELEAKFDTGELPPETLVWAEHLGDWTPASALPDFKHGSVSFVPHVKPAGTPPIPEPGHYHFEAIRDTSVPQVRPWVRFFARSIDMMLFSIIFDLFLLFVYPAVFSVMPVVIGMVTPPLWIPFESYLLSRFGYTPGKWILRTSVTDKNGQKPTYNRAIARSCGVWLRGLGLGIPIVILITCIIAYFNLKKNGETSWDKNQGFIVSHLEIGTGRVVFGFIVFFVAFFITCLIFGAAVMSLGGYQ